MSAVEIAKTAWKHMMTILCAIRDALWPHCSACKKRLLIVFDNTAELQKLRPLGEYQAAYDRYTRLCKRCWIKIATVPCDLCQASVNVFENKLNQLTQNLRAHSVTLDEVSSARRVCELCSERRLHCACSRCSKSFPCTSDTAAKYKSSTDVLQWLAPYHKDYQENWFHLCPECFHTCLTSCKDVQTRLSQWVGSTKGEFIRDFKTVQTIGRVDYKGTGCDEPEKVEEWLRLYTVQVGGNAFVKYYWEKQEERHSDRVIAGYGHKGNPYYKTESWTKRWFTGYATAVIVEPFSKQRASPGRIRA